MVVSDRFWIAFNRDLSASRDGYRPKRECRRRQRPTTPLVVPVRLHEQSQRRERRGMRLEGGVGRSMLQRRSSRNASSRTECGDKHQMARSRDKSVTQGNHQRCSCNRRSLGSENCVTQTDNGCRVGFGRRPAALGTNQDGCVA